MERYQQFARDVTTGEPAPLATITVYDAGTLDLASIFSDDLGSPTVKSNPFTSDAITGYFFFYAANARYDVKVEKTGLTTYTLSDISLGQFKSLQGLTAAALDLQFGSSGTDLNVTTPDSDTIQLNVPDASATNRGVITTGAQTIAGAKTFSTAIAVDSGGTGLSSAPTNGQLLIGNGTNFTLATLTGTSNQVTVANGSGTITLSLPQNIHTAASPTFAGLTLSSLTVSSALIANGSKALTSVVLTDGQLLIGDTGNSPTAATLTAGTGISITNGAGSITIASTVAAISSLNSLTSSAQTFATGTSGTDFNISSAGSTHTFNIPDASASNRGLVTTGNQVFAGAKTFNAAPVFGAAPTGIHTFLFSRCDATLTKNADTTLEDVSGLAFPVGANEVWTFQFHMRVISVAAADHKFTLTGPGSPTSIWFGAPTHAGGGLGTAAATAFATAVPIHSIGTDEPALLIGLLRNGANAGTVQLQFAQNSNNASDSKVYEDSYVLAWRIS